MYWDEGYGKCRWYCRRTWLESWRPWKWVEKFKHHRLWLRVMYGLGGKGQHESKHRNFWSIKSSECCWALTKDAPKQAEKFKHHSPWLRVMYGIEQTRIHTPETFDQINWVNAVGYRKRPPPPTQVEKFKHHICHTSDIVSGQAKDQTNRINAVRHWQRTLRSRWRSSRHKV